MPRSRLTVVVDMLKAVNTSVELEAASCKPKEVIEKLEAMRVANAARSVGEAVELALAYYLFPREHRRRIRTNNALERIIREIRRCTRVVGSFPDSQSALML